MYAARLLNVKRTNVKGETGKNLAANTVANRLRFPAASGTKGAIYIDDSTGTPYLSDGVRWISLQGKKGENLATNSYPTYLSFPPPSPGAFAFDEATGTPYVGGHDGAWKSLKGSKGQPAASGTTQSLDRWLSLEEDGTVALQTLRPQVGGPSVDLGSEGNPFDRVFCKTPRIYGNRIAEVGTKGSKVSPYTALGVEELSGRIKVTRDDGTSVYLVTTDPGDPTAIDASAFKPRASGLRLAGTADPAEDPEFFGKVRAPEPGDFYVVSGAGAFAPGTVVPGDESAQKGDVYVYVPSTGLSYDPVPTRYDLPPASASEGKIVLDRSTGSLYFASGSQWARILHDGVPAHSEREKRALEDEFYGAFERTYNAAPIAAGGLGTGQKISGREGCFYLAEIPGGCVVGAVCDYTALPSAPSPNYRDVIPATREGRLDREDLLPFMTYRELRGGEITMYCGHQVNFREVSGLWAAFESQVQLLWKKSCQWISDGTASGPYSFPDVRESDLAANLRIIGRGSVEKETFACDVRFFPGQGSLLRAVTGQ